MSERETEKREWDDPKDFGLPFVEINPMNSSQKSSTADSVTSEKFSDFPGEKQTTAPESKSDEFHRRKYRKSKRRGTAKKKTSNFWVWIVLSMTIVVVGVILWQLQLEYPDSSEPVPDKISQSAGLPAEGEINQPVQSSPIAEQEVDNSKDSIANISDSNPTISKDSETGTTIAKGSPVGNLIRIDSKAEKVRYFVVVASLPNEKLALEMVEKYSGKSPELYLISPYGSSSNYRLAVSKFDSWKAASLEAERIKPQFSGDLWILNY